MSEPLELARWEFSAPDDGPHLLVTGGVHGDEFEPIFAIRRLIGLLSGAQGDSPLARGRVTLVPIVNEAAYHRGRRTADDGLDLARVCPGRPNGSITERTAHALSGLIRAADYYIDLHSGGIAYRVLPLAGYNLHPDERVLEAQRAMARAFNLPIVWGTSPEFQGRSLSVARDAGVPGIYAEYLGAGGCSAEGIEAYVEGCLNVMLLLGMIDRKPPASRIEEQVEDPRPQSGHMQVCNPSPMTGLFEPAVELGQFVEIDDVLGTVSDPLGEATATVRTRQRGRVLVLRSFPCVAEGDGLAVILESPEMP